MIWFVFIILTGLAVLSALWPLSRSARADDESASDVAFYRAQMAEIAADSERGLADAQEAEAERARAARRLLALSAAQKCASGAASSRKTRLTAALIALIGVPAIAFGLYSLVGHPDAPDLPLQARFDGDPRKLSLEGAVAKMEAHLAAHPDDGRAYEIVAPVYLRMGRPADAAQARAEALRLLGETAERRALYGEALIYAADGIVSAEAAQEFDRALAIDPKQQMARYYLGIAAAQEGDKERARDFWSKLAAEAPANSPLAKMLAEKIALLDAPFEDDKSQPPPPAAKEAAPAKPGAAAIAGMSKDERAKTIGAMVEGLARRLAAQGGDADSWLRLIRAYKVLDESDKSRAALADARKALAQDAAAQERLTTLAQELGLETKK